MPSLQLLCICPRNGATRRLNHHSGKSGIIHHVKCNVMSASAGADRTSSSVCDPSKHVGKRYSKCAEWHNDIWAIIAIVWIDSPALENPKVLGLSLSASSTKYDKLSSASFINGTTPILMRYTPGLSTAKLQTVDVSAGDFQDRIVWEQLTEEARFALNDKENFGRADVPMSDENYYEWLDSAWPF
ncbi:hypothetical protein P3T76_004088 [Phytophthora citrophthora]|uniref:Uncharacterized protein n=1 Tax=Phytophthora citrophthora TaxID=4793 RepID=A0AAD9GU81_9STRA|nr:hypothetical protein P3T76_004088 [Phytophthora citrophthora]